MTSPQAVLAALYDADQDSNAEEALATPPEGQEIRIPYKGSVIDVLHRIRGHLASAVSYAAGDTLSEVRARIAQDPMKYLIPLSASSFRESYER
jgi:hypothetical protein